MPAELAWLHGWPRMGLSEVLIGSAMHCIGCGRLHGIISVVVNTDWTPPSEQPTWPFTPGDCPVCAVGDPPSPVFEIRTSDLRHGQEWLLDGAWVRIVNVVVRHPDDRVAITYEQDGEQVTTREYRGTDRAAIR